MYIYIYNLYYYAHTKSKGQKLAYFGVHTKLMIHIKILTTLDLVAHCVTNEFTKLNSFY